MIRQFIERLLCEHKWARDEDCPAVFVMNWHCTSCNKHKQTFFKVLA